MNKKTLAIVAVLMVLVSVLSVFATLAYLQDTSNTVHNTFTSGNVSIKLDEKDIKNDETRTESGNEYFALPGQSYDKDPTVTVVEGSEDSFVGMKVVVNGADVFKDDTVFTGVNEINVKTFLDNFTNYEATSAWKLTKSEEVDNTYVYYFVNETVVVKNDDADTTLAPLFTKVMVPGTFDNAQMDAFEGTVSIDVTGYAVQQTGFTDAYDALSKAFDTNFAKS